MATHAPRCFEWLVDLVVRNNTTRTWGSKFKKVPSEAGATKILENELHRIREELRDLGIRVGINNGELDMSTGKIERYLS